MKALFKIIICDKVLADKNQCSVYNIKENKTRKIYNNANISYICNSHSVITWVLNFKVSLRIQEVII